MSKEPIDRFATGQSTERAASVRLGSKAGHEKRTLTLFGDYADPAALRSLAGRIKQHTIDHLDTYLERAARRLEEHGARVHFAVDAESACRTVASILGRRQAKRVVKAKTMVSEEIALAHHLEKHGIECLETDLGEFVVQISADSPSHIVKPIIHKNRREIAESFEKNGLGPYDDTPEVITRRAREFMRRKYLSADAAVTGANFVSAESGRLVLVTNEGNSRFCMAATRCHIAIVGIEKLVPTDRDLALFLNLLARSGTGQQLTVYTEFIGGPRAAGQPDGPDEMHVVVLDNGRTDVLASECREILRCIRCGASLNVCPVYRQASGHAYRSVYPGPVGAVLSPLLAGSDFAELSDLPRRRPSAARATRCAPSTSRSRSSSSGFATAANARAPKPPARPRWSRGRSSPRSRSRGGRRSPRVASSSPCLRGSRPHPSRRGAITTPCRPGAGAPSAPGSRNGGPTVDDRAIVFARVRAALAPPAERQAMPTYADDLSVMHGAPEADDDIEGAFTRQLTKVSGRVFVRAADLAAWLVERGDVHGYCDPALLPELGPDFAGRLTLETKIVRGRIDDFRFGVTRASAAIAETGTIVLDDETTSSRLGALAPWIHVAVVRKKAIHRRVVDAVRALGNQANVVWCTGPSKTADVEGILIEGVHGPGEQVALVLP